MAQSNGQWRRRERADIPGLSQGSGRAQWPNQAAYVGVIKISYSRK